MNKKRIADDRIKRSRLETVTDYSKDDLVTRIGDRDHIKQSPQTPSSACGLYAKLSKIGKLFLDASCLVGDLVTLCRVLLDDRGSGLRQEARIGKLLIKLGAIGLQFSKFLGQARTLCLEIDQARKGDKHLEARAKSHS